MQHMKSPDELKMYAFHVLFPCIAKLIEASVAPPHPHSLHYAKAIAIATFRQACSACALLHPVPVPLTRDITVSDPLSVNVIIRSILESYLAWEQMFIKPSDESEREFWYFAWALKSLKVKTSQAPRLPDVETAQKDDKTGNKKMVKAIDVYNNMLKNIEELQTALKNNPFYKTAIVSGDKKREDRFKKYAEEGWETKPSFLLEQSMPGLHKRKIYDHLSRAAHLDHIDVKQVVYSQTHEEIISFAELSLSVLNQVLARFCEQYPILFPATKSIADEDADVQMWIKAFREADQQ